MHTSVKFLLLLHSFIVLDAAQLPKSWGRCSVKDPDFDECTRKGVESAIVNLKNGAPELGMGSFHPLEITKLVIGSGTGPVNVVQNFTNVQLYGLVDSIVHEVKVDIEKKMITAKSTTPEIRLEADYTMNGRVLLLPIFGEGRANVTLKNTKINHTLIAESFTKKGKTFWRIVDFNITLRPDMVQFHFANLFNGEERLGTEINKVLNDNWDPVFTDVRPGYEKSLGLVFQDLANRVFNRVPLKDIFLDLN